MKTTALKSWTAVCLSVLTATVGFRAFAEQTETAIKPDKTYTGTVTTVELQNRVLTVKGLLFSKQFNLGDTCRYTMPGRLTASADDLRVGQKVTVSYQDTGGVLVASRIAQQPMQYAGMVRAVDPEKRTLTLHTRGLNRVFDLGDNCLVVVRNNQSGGLSELKPGSRVRVTYELPAGKGNRVARQIVWTGATFEGELTAIDLTDRTLKARAVFNSRKFNLARDCAISLPDRTHGRLRDLKLGDKLALSYEDVNGVSVVNRIAIAEARPTTITAQTLGD